MVGFSFRQKIEILRRQLLGVTINYSKFDFKTSLINSLPYPVKWQKVNNYKKLYCEIGTGHGETLAHLASSHPDSLYIGFEITAEYTRKTRNKIKTVPNAFAYKAEAYREIPYLFEKESLDGIYVLFPDPWHKKKHHKRRPLTAKWFTKVHSRLKPGGTIFFATDWEEYFAFVLEQAQKTSDHYSLELGVYTPEAFDLVPTYYYKKWQKVGGRKFQFIKLTRSR
ncbi:MAG: hypothetical protein Fur003_4620 [Candidatus Dojkabacteria bacterium]